MKTEYFQNVSRSTFNILKEVPARRLSSLEAKEGLTQSKRTNAAADMSFWSSKDSHQILPVFASGNAFVPSAFDSILAQAFYTAFTPLLLERLVCGSKHQAIFQVDVPEPFIGSYFVDIFRAFLSRNLMIMAIYRAPVLQDGAILPFVFTSPYADVLIRENDRIFVLCSPEALENNFSLFEQNFVIGDDGNLSLAGTIGEQLKVPIMTRTEGTTGGSLEKTEEASSSSAASVHLKKASKPAAFSSSSSSNSVSPQSSASSPSSSSPQTRNNSLSSRGALGGKRAESPVREKVSNVFFKGEQFTSRNG